MTDYERGYKDGMAGAALPNIIDNGDKIVGYNYSYKTDSEGVPYINIDCVRAMLAKAAQSVSVIKELQEQIASVKRSVKLENHGYLTGYIAALSAVEGMIAEITKG